MSRVMTWTLSWVSQLNTYLRFRGQFCSMTYTERAGWRIWGVFFLLHVSAFSGSSAGSSSPPLLKVSSSRDPFFSASTVSLVASDYGCQCLCHDTQILCPALIFPISRLPYPSGELRTSQGGVSNSNRMRTSAPQTVAESEGKFQPWDQGPLTFYTCIPSA